MTRGTGQRKVILTSLKTVNSLMLAADSKRIIKTH